VSLEVRNSVAMRLVGNLFTGLCLLLWAPNTGLTAGKARHVLVLVWDGMRPDFVSETTTPNLWKLATEGVRFQNHHPVYVSSTEVNGTALATGVDPERSGIIANKEFRPNLDAFNPIFTADAVKVRRADELTGNHFLQVPTLAETLQGFGLRTAVAGAKPVALLQDRQAGSKTNLGVDLFEGKVMPEALWPELKTAVGRFPRTYWTNRKRDRWTTQALLGPLWAKGVPAFSLLWLSEPDTSQHKKGPGSKRALKCIKSCDDNLARVLEALDQKGIRGETDIIVVSDHGFSSISARVNVEALLNSNGFRAGRKYATNAAPAGQILVVGNGGSVLLYVPNHEQALIERVVHWLQSQPFAGVILTRTPVEGTFPLESVKIQSTNAPDIVVSLRWRPDLNRRGVPGLLYADATSYSSGKGMHASLSRFDMHNICIAAGPDFRKGFEDHLPTGNVDIVPTILWILGVEPKEQLSGRVLAEALAQTNVAAPSSQSHRLEATYHGTNFVWQQYLNFSEVNGVIYLQEGNGQQVTQPTANK